MNNHYETPLSSRYASEEMSQLFSPQFKHTTWRKLWVALAKAEKDLGLSISDTQIAALEAHQDKIDFERVAHFEKTFRHDVMAHIHAYGETVPEAKGVLHLGATSAFVTDNTDLIQMRTALQILHAKCLQVIRQLAQFAETYAALPCLSFTHLQAAQPTTVGKRACLWLQDLLFDFQDLAARIDDLHFLGVKGATGTQASFLSLFENDAEKVKQLEKSVARRMGFTKVIPLSGQTYTRKQDMRVFSALAGLAASASKIATDLRLLAHMKEIEEPFAEKQIGSSAMPYKRNPMRCERICALARYLIALNENPAYTAATQWLERSLDDSANRRLTLPEGFLTADALLNLLADVTNGLLVYPHQIQKHLDEELPLLATENILMAAVKKGGDRQLLHDKLRTLSLQAKQECKMDQLLERIAADIAFGLTRDELSELLNISHFTGRAESQVREFLAHISELLKQHASLTAHLPPTTL
jgi:adenylosuccinate lyase